jgi:DNA repair ATPase RecN
MSKRNILIIISAVVIVVIGIILITSSSRPIPEDKFVELYIKLSLIHEKYKYNPPELEKEKQKILDENNITMQDVEKFIKKYKKKPEKWVKLWEKINQELERLKKEGSFTPP